MEEGKIVSVQIGSEVREYPTGVCGSCKTAWTATAISVFSLRQIRLVSRHTGEVWFIC